MPNTRHLITVPFSRLDSDNRMVYGYASTGAVDSYDTIIDPAWWPHAISGYLQTRQLTENHDHNRVIGDVPILEVLDEGLWIGARIADEGAWEKISTNEYNGFSVEAYAYDLEEEEGENGNYLIHFKKYILEDITVGYPAANKEARFAYLERLEKSDEPWDFDWERDADNIVAALGWDGLKAATLLQGEGDPKSKDTYEIPVAKMKEGKLTVFRNALRAAVAVLNGARGSGFDDETRARAYKRIREYYRTFGEVAPELRLKPMGEGDEMSKFTKAVLETLKRLSGKDADDTARKEVEALEKELSDEKDEQITRLTEGLDKVVERLDELETPSDGGDDDDDTDPVAETLERLEGRLERLEKRSGKTKQPKDDTGTTGDEPTKLEPGMNQFIRTAVANRRGY